MTTINTVRYGCDSLQYGADTLICLKDSTNVPLSGARLAEAKAMLVDGKAFTSGITYKFEDFADTEYAELNAKQYVGGDCNTKTGDYHNPNPENLTIHGIETDMPQVVVRTDFSTSNENNKSGGQGAGRRGNQNGIDQNQVDDDITKMFEGKSMGGSGGYGASVHGIAVKESNAPGYHTYGEADPTQEGDKHINIRLQSFRLEM